jgi:protein TonB
VTNPGVSESPLAVVRAAAESPPVRLTESSAPPLFPLLARRLRLQANVVLDIVVRRDGSVGNVVVSSSTLPGYGFEQAAVEAVRGWRYRPGTRGGRPIDASLSVVVTFR